MRNYDLAMPDTIFTKVIRGQIPCHKVYEDSLVFAFLDVNPISEGHTLVVPKEAAETVDTLSDEAGAAVGRALPRICRAVLKATGAKAYNILQNNGREAHQAVFHVHFHVIPRYADRAEGGGLGIGWRAGSLDANQGRELAAKIAAQL
jgi:histidine triad (HIT) family protein